MRLIPSFPAKLPERNYEGKDDRTLYQEYFSRQINFEALIAGHPDDEDMLREMLELLVDTVCSKRRFIRIAGDDKPAEVVKAQLMKLEQRPSAVCPYVPEGEHHPGAEHPAVSAGHPLQRTADHEQLLHGAGTA